MVVPAQRGIEADRSTGRPSDAAPVGRGRPARRRALRRDVERLASAGRVAAGIADEMATLLASLATDVGRLRSEPALAAESRARVEGMGESLARALAMSRQLSALSRIDPAAPTAVLDRVVAEAMGLAAALLGPGVEVELRLGAGNASVPVAPAEVRQVLLNLLLNVRDALEGAGHVRVETALRPSAPDDVRGAVLIVADDGPGMDDGVRRRAPESGFTTRPGGGRGIGLASVRSIVDRAAGRLEIDSAPGAGTRVRVLLPLTPSGPAPGRE